MTGWEIFRLFLYVACALFVPWIGYCIFASIRRDWISRSIKRRPWPVERIEE